MNLSVPFVALDAVIVGALLLLVALGVRHRGRPGAGAAASLWFALAVVAFVLAFARVEAVSVQFAMYAIIVGWTVTVPLWAGFVFSYTGRGPSVTRRWMALAGGYVAILAGTTLNAGAFAGTVGSLVQIAASVLQTALIGVGLFAVFLLVRSAVTYDDLPVGQAVALSVGGIGVSLLSFSLNSRYQSPAGPEALPVLPTIFLAVTAGAFAVGALRYRPFSETPGTGPLARTSVFDEMSEAVIVLDRDRRLVDANEAAERTLGVTVARDAGRPAEEILGYDPDGVAGETVPTPDGRRRFDVSRSALTNRRGDEVGTSYLFQDVTDRRTGEQRLEVLNRVLRHNLRNDLDAVRGFAEALSDGAVDDPEGTAERIRTTADELVDIGETVERADRVMTRDAVERRQTDLADLVETVAADVRGAYDCRVSVAARGGELTLTTDRNALRTALREVVENAAEHSDCREPTVEIELERTEGGARIAVRDDGPGIPERERAVLLEGEETPLQHGAGIGLWFVSWAVTRLGGELSFADAEGSGSEVILDVPDRSPGRE